MKTRQLQDLEGKINDFKICAECNSLNWYENESCHNCISETFIDNEKSIKKSPLAINLVSHLKLKFIFNTQQ